jgi:hypothetical protein
VTAYDRIRAEIELKAERTRRALLDHISRGQRLALVKAPPGSGKTHLLIEASYHAWRAGLRVAVACQTNGQADDVCRRLARDYPTVRPVRFAGSAAQPRDLGPAVKWATQKTELPDERCVVVGTAAKWGTIILDHAFDLLFVDEAWQMAWKEFMLCGQVAGRFILIGDPGQIPPVITIDTARWETSPRPPHLPAPEVILGSGDIECLALELPASRRLPHDTVQLIQPFYDFPFGSFAGPGERAIVADQRGRTPMDRAIDLLREGSVAAVTLPTPASGPPLERDEEVAAIAAEIVARLLERGAKFQANGTLHRIEPHHVGVAATHRVMNMEVHLKLPRELRGAVKVDTPERWQGLQCPVMVVVHPLSGVTRPSAFDLDTGRLCVMASRHQGGLIVVGRNHLGETLGKLIPSAAQAVRRPDVTGRGHEQHLAFWTALERQERVVRA